MRVDATAQPATRNRWTDRIARHTPPGQFCRYLLVGIWNTAFGYGTFALFTMLLQRISPHGYIAASVLSSLLNITVAFFGYKWFVFKTKGNYLREWARCVAVYSGAIVITAALLPLVVLLLHRTTTLTNSAPYVAGALLIGITTIYSFIGHRKFSFRSQA